MREASLRRHVIEPRANWREQAEAVGFTFHHMDGALYWDESAWYAFSLDQVEDHIEAAAAELHQMCLGLVDEVVRSDALMRSLAIPQSAREYIAESWRRREPSLYGRFDFAYDGEGPPKLYEYNADTPTSVFEAAVFQWLWLEARLEDGALPEGADQFNSLHERLVERWAAIAPPGPVVHFSSDEYAVEDRQTVRYLEDTAKQAGLTPKFVDIDNIGVTAVGRFVDNDDAPIASLFKLHPWEEILRAPFAEHLARSRVQFIEPAWKAILSNKGILPLLWERYPGHPNLLPAYFGHDRRVAEFGGSYVSKPLFSREGANIRLVDEGREHPVLDQGYGGEGRIVQALHPLPDFGGVYPVVGAWLVGDEPSGMGVREDADRVTKNFSRFVPHAIISSPA
jgi:glutathionylspermidine synthase